MLVGIDTEYGLRPGDTSHGTIGAWANVIQTGVLAHVTNGQSAILVIGGGKTSTDMMTSFWNQIGTALGRTVVYSNSAAISNVNLNNYAMIAVVNSTDGSGKLTQNELNLISARRSDIVTFVCNGGAVFGSSCDLNPSYGYITGVGSITTAMNQYTDIDTTAAGNAVGITSTNLDGGPWHTVFNTFPPFLQVLATSSVSGRVAAIGGANTGGAAVAAYTLPQTQYPLGIGTNIIADGTPSQNEGRHFWSIVESDQYWNTYGVEINDWFVGTAGIKDLTQFAASKNFLFKCGAYYRIKLAVESLCTPWNETVKLIQIRGGGFIYDITTGMLTNGVKAPNGAPDSKWQMRAIPGTLYTGAIPPAYVVQPGSGQFPWITVGYASWISAKANPNGGAPSLAPTAMNNTYPPNPAGINYYYEYRFWVDPTQVNNLTIKINRIAADNQARVYLNSNVLSGSATNYTSVGLNTWSTNNFLVPNGPFNITTGFVKGWNTLLIEVLNNTQGPDKPLSPTGLLLYGWISGQCK